MQKYTNFKKLEILLNNRWMLHNLMFAIFSWMWAKVVKT